jgi:Ser/Thr protein kinase RdoA (MazF antagonist)
VHTGNAHFCGEDRVTLFDFGQCGYGWRAFEIGKFLTTMAGMKVDVAVQADFLDGYQEIRRLEDVELEAVPAFMKVAALWVMGINIQNVDLFGAKLLNDAWFDGRIRALKELVAPEFAFGSGQRSASENQDSL